MYVEKIMRHRKSILVSWVALLLVSMLFLSHKLLLSDEVIIDNSVSIWFDKEDPELLDYQAYNDVFGEEEWTLLLLQTDFIYAPEFLRDLQKITDAIIELEHIVKVTSITNVRDNFVTDDEILDYRELYSERVLLDTKALEEFRDQLKRNPIFERNLILRDNDKYTVVLIQNANYIEDQSTYRVELIDSIYEIIKRHKSINKYALAGTTVVNAELNRAASRDVVVFYALATVLLTLIAFVMLRSFRNLIAMYAVVVTSALPTMGLLAALGIAFNMVTVMLPTILIALSVAGVIHIITEFHAARNGHDSEAAMRQTLRRLYKPTLWTTLTTVVGFSAFTTSNVFPVFQLGAFAAFGLLLACIANLVIAPILLLILWPDHLKLPTTGKQKNFIGALQVKKYLVPSVSVLLMVVALSTYGLSRLEVDTNYIKFFASSHQTTQSYDLIRQAGFAQNPVIIYLRYDEYEPYSSASSLSGTLEFEDAVKKQPEVVKLLSGSDFLSQIDLAFNGESGQSLRQYDKRQIEQLLLLGELSGNDDLADFIVEGSAEVQLVAMTHYMSSRELESFSQNLDKLKKAHLPDNVTMKITGTTTLWANMDTEVSKTQFLSLVLIGLFLALFLPVIFGSLKLGFVGLMINVFPLAVTLGCMSLLDIKINIATALIGGITLGVVVDDTIHFITRFIQNRRNGQDAEGAVDDALRSIGSSIVKTTFILVVGFSCMATSEFLPTAHFGIFISLSIVLALILDLIYLPALLRTGKMTTTSQVYQSRLS